MKAFVTGATGFIGTHLVKRLTESHHDLHCLVRKSSPAAEHLGKPGVTSIAGDVGDRSSLLRGMEGCDWVIHLAGLYSFWERDRRMFREVNVTGTRNVMECALEAGVRKVIHVSTVGVFGKPDKLPFTEKSQPGPVRWSDYFQTKSEGDAIVWDLHRTRKLPVVVVYPSAVLGVGDTKATGRYISDLVHRRLPATVFDDSVLTFVHVRDVAEVVVRAAEKEGNIGERYIAGKERLSFREVNHLVSELSGVRVPPLHLPGWLAMFNARMLTMLSVLTGTPPLWGLSVDQVSVMKEGFSADGSKAERELGVRYTPVRTAIAEAIASIRSS